MAQNEPQAGRLTIGQLSDRCRLPVTTLRYYHKIGLLIPAAVDARTGYRYYDRRQVAAAAMVAELRALGLSPSVIAAVVSDPPRASVVLEEERKRLLARIEADRALIGRLESLIDGADGSAAPKPASGTTSEVTEVMTPTSGGLELCGHLRAEHGVGDLRRLLVELRRANVDQLPQGRSPRFAARFPLHIEAEPVPVTVFIESPVSESPVTESPVSESPVTESPVIQPDLVRSGPASEPVQPGLAVTHHGPYNELWSAYERLLESVAADARQPGDVVIERYLEPEGGRPRTQLVVPIDDTRAHG